MRVLCPWCGLPCTTFPYLKNGTVPPTCEALIRTLPALVPLRRLSR